MPKSLLAVAVLCLFVLPVGAQNQLGTRPAASVQSLPADAASRDQIMTLLDLLQVRRNMTAMMENMKKVMKDSAEQAFRRKMPNPTAKQLEALHSSIDAALGDLPLDEMINAVVAVYQRHLSKTDLEELLRFYSSPVGQKLIREQPVIMQESMQAGAEIQNKRMDEILAKVDKSLQKLDEAEKEPAPPAKSKK
jgi:uncharacterized protein